SNYTPGNKAKARDYDSEGQAIILRAAAYYEAKVIGVDCFPDRAMQIGWTNKAFQDACRTAGKNYECDMRVGKIIRGRGSRVQGEMLTYVRDALISIHDFSSDTSKKAKRQNQKLYDKLSDRMAFAYRDIDNRRGFAENPIFQLILRLACFGKGPESRSVVFSRFFNPVSLETLAFFMTLIRYSLEQYSTGIYIKPGKNDGFTEQQNKGFYKKYLDELQSWTDCNPVFVENFRKRMYSHAREKLGIDPTRVESLITGSIKANMRIELADRTGETDTEDEGNDFEPVAQDDMDQEDD
ncbi:hypothetical protein K435DRAFT_808275, partial [Dendrothele bispora CBS 962.96]